MTSKPRFLVGIDLGTTNSAVAAVDLSARPRRVADVPVRQLVAPGDVAARPTLPSFLYLTGEHELPGGATALPWNPQARDVVGELARSQGAQVPGRLVSSAKSWLIHPDVDREASGHAFDAGLGGGVGEAVCASVFAGHRSDIDDPADASWHERGGRCFAAVEASGEVDIDDPSPQFG